MFGFRRGGHKGLQAQEQQFHSGFAKAIPAELAQLVAHLSLAVIQFKCLAIG